MRRETELDSLYSFCISTANYRTWKRESEGGRGRGQRKARDFKENLNIFVTAFAKPVISLSVCLESTLDKDLQDFCLRVSLFSPILFFLHSSPFSICAISIFIYITSVVCLSLTVSSLCPGLKTENEAKRQKLRTEFDYVDYFSQIHQYKLYQRSESTCLVRLQVSQTDAVSFPRLR